MAVRTKTELASQITTLLADNTTGNIGADDVRSVFTDVIDSLAFLTDSTDVLFGSGVPASSLGKDTDAYLDVDTGTWYGKAAGAWDAKFTFELTNDQLHALSQIAGLEAKTADLAIEDSYTFADTTDGDIAIRSDAPPAPWLTAALWDPMLTYSSQDAAGGNDYLVLRIGHDADITTFRVEIERTSGTVYYNGSAFRRIHKSETTHAYYAHPGSHFRVHDELQVQEGTVTGEITEYRGMWVTRQSTAAGSAGTWQRRSIPFRSSRMRLTL